jgi:hypothetical protein
MKWYTTRTGKTRNTKVGPILTLEKLIWKHVRENLCQKIEKYHKFQ